MRSTKKKREKLFRPFTEWNVLELFVFFSLFFFLFLSFVLSLFLFLDDGVRHCGTRAQFLQKKGFADGNSDARCYLSERRLSQKQRITSAQVNT